MITFEQIAELDRRLISEGRPLHRRPFGVMTRLLPDADGASLVEPELWTAVDSAYVRLYPASDRFPPPVIVGGACIGESFYVARVSVSYQRTDRHPLEFLEISDAELATAWKQEPDQVWQAIYNVCDLWDITYGMDAQRGGSSEADVLWAQCASELHASAAAVRTELNVESLVASSGKAAEFALKAALATAGFSELKRRFFTHNVPLAAEAMCATFPTPADEDLMKAAIALPHWGDARDLPQLSRAELNGTTTRAQYIAAEAARRVTGRSLLRRIFSHPDAPKRRY